MSMGNVSPSRWERLGKTDADNIAHNGDESSSSEVPMRQSGECGRGYLALLGEMMIACDW